ncbi:NAD-dependent epimerase/dehydratase family protein [Nocardioides rubriscoriae]|uniref:NAD-dependent epimerase/dehydratase family protein n=1 Tax=Nocardioides rubriscoriae TaxID=642762 RepID=UPI0011DFAE5F|nr:NAD-dependent epimerase/dehydratase family protein [Nocardioides rubriscoriae]
MRVAVTGINGFVGRHLAAELVSSGHEVVGVGLGSPIPETAGLLSDHIQHDLTESWPSIDVAAVIHLAALSSVGPSFDDPQAYISANSQMVTHLGEASLRSAQPPRVLLVSSGAVYSPDQQMPIDEDGQIAFASPYAVSKVLNENQAGYYAHRGLAWTVVRPFNHIGPGQRSGFLLPDLYDAVALAARSGEPALVGDLTTQRDYTDVRDVVRAYRLLVEGGGADVGPFNVCSGRAVSGQALLGELLSAMGAENVRIEVDENRLRPTDPRLIVGDHKRLRDLCGWVPIVDTASTVRDFVAECDRATSRGAAL